jgi:hypothetical protein
MPILKVARAIADLNSKIDITPKHAPSIALCGCNHLKLAVKEHA